VRFFILLGELIGFLLYYLTIGALVMKGARQIIFGIRFFFRLVWKWMLRPVVLLLGWAGRKIKRILRKLGKSMKKAVQKHRKHLQIRRTILYNYFKNRVILSLQKRKKE